ncbi:MAG: hypothetical protein E7598_01785 [Ruminococcaceae bacterium]|nr:hypothetical protein [Oscillospiraceae bacterium]
MNKTYFPGANSGRGFFSRFSGIVAPWEGGHYTYVLKGGPGVGKNTLMKKVAKHATEKGYDVEEFRCASDPSSLDAVRIVQKGVVLLDGTAPHSIDPVLPGICDEVVDLGHFKNQAEFATFKGEVEELFFKNKTHYRTAYSMLGAALSLKKEALAQAREMLDIKKLHTYLSSFFAGESSGEKRELFARSATPKGVVDYTETFLPDNTVCFSGIVGEAALCEALKLFAGKRCEVFYDFLVPECPRAIVFSKGAIALADSGDTLKRFCSGVESENIQFLLSECESLTLHACEELSKSLHTHDEIEKLYRDYVDYDRVNEESEKLIKRLKLN